MEEDELNPENNGSQKPESEGKPEGKPEEKPKGQETDPKGDKGEKGESDESTKLLREVMKWKERARDAEGKLSDSSKTLEEIEKTLGDLSVEELGKLVEERRESERLELERKGEYERITTRMKEENERLLGERETAITELQSKLDQALAQIDDLTVGNAFNASKFIQEDSVIPANFARNEFGKHFEMVDGNLVAFDKPQGQSERTKLVDANGAPLPFDQAIAELYSKHPNAEDLVKSKQKPGAGSRTVDNGGKSGEQAQTGTGVNRLASILSKGNNGFS